MPFSTTEVVHAAVKEGIRVKQLSATFLRSAGGFPVMAICPRPLQNKHPLARKGLLLLFTTEKKERKSNSYEAFFFPAKGKVNSRGTCGICSHVKLNKTIPLKRADS